MPRALSRTAGGLFALALASIVASACTSYDPNEDVGITSLGLDAKCTADVNGVGTVDVETDYLPHVVHCENGGAPLESLKAQAVAARTFLYYKLQTSGSIGDGQGDQVYTCASEPDDDDREAVAETRASSFSTRARPSLRSSSPAERPRHQSASAPLRRAPRSTSPTTLISRATPSSSHRSGT